nr:MULTISPECIES: SDR family oxidoreductase [Acidaminococcus]
MEDYEKIDLKSFPLGRYGHLDEYGRLAAFLCSEANSYVSGQTILLDGAMTKAY